jgi:hypothetical protein
VIERQLRFTSEKDVIFRRYRGEELSVFAINEEFQAVKETKADVATVDVLAASVAQNKKDATDALKVAESTLDEKFTKLKTGSLADLAVKIGTVEGSAKILDAKIDAVKAEVIAASNAAFWVHTKPSAQPTNTPSKITLAGSGFEQYYSPDYDSMFSCTFKPESGDSIVTGGKVVRYSGEGKFYHRLVCDGPGLVKKKTKFSLSVTYDDSAGKTTIEFKGKSGKDTVQYSTTWSATNIVDKKLIVDVAGLDITAKYTCIFEDVSSDIKKSTTGSFVEGSFGLKIDCGAVPTGFDIQGTKSSVKFTMKLAGTSEFVLNAGDGDGTISINTCRDGIKDGKETDVDCGGPCAPTYGCGPQGACNADSDCSNGTPCVNKKCGLDGKTKATAGKTCKAIRLHVPTSKNGKYYVTGPNNEYKSDPKRVFCWQSDRDGGGWTLGVKSWYGQHHSLPRNGQGARGNIDQSVLGHLGQHYKMDDREIRTYLGQPSPQSDSMGGGKTAFSYMIDQSRYNAYYSGHNREYVIGKNYKARWFAYHWRPVDESETKHEFSSYIMKGNFNGVDTQGEGTLNWRGQPRCGHGRVGGMGVSCYGMTSGSAPRGGRGCKTNLNYGGNGNNNWQGQFEVKMWETNWDTYVYVCEGAQHSSSNRFARRIWFRTHDDNKEY